MVTRSSMLPPCGGRLSQVDHDSSILWDHDILKLARHNLYSSSRLVTLGLSSMTPLRDELLRREIPQGLMGPHRVVDPFPPLQGLVEGPDGRLDRADIVELLAVRALGPLDAPVELRRPRGQHEEAQPPLLAGGLEGRLELAAPLDLQRPG